MKKILIGIVIGIVLTTGVVLASSYIANDILYTPSDSNWNVNNVGDAIDDIYNHVNKQPVQVATLTTQGATYTMQNDGYITGTVAAKTGGNGAYITLDGTYIYTVDYRETATFNASIYAPKNSVITTRSDGGIYNLTVYEWK